MPSPRAQQAELEGEEAALDAAAAEEAQGAGPYRRVRVEVRPTLELGKELLPIVRTSPGKRLAVALSPVEDAAPRRLKAAAAIALFVLGAVLLPIALSRGGRGDYPLFWLVLASGVAMAAGAFLARHSLGTALLHRVKPPRVELDHEPVARGESVGLFVVQPGPVRFFSFCVKVGCEERYEVALGSEVGGLSDLRRVASQGAVSTIITADIHMRSEPVSAQVLFETHDLDIPLNEPFELNMRFEIPPDGPVSFLASRHAVEWFVEVTSGFDRDSETTHRFPFRVLPWR